MHQQQSILPRSCQMHQLNGGVHSQCILYLLSFTIMPIYKAQILSLSHTQFGSKEFSLQEK